VSRAPRVSGVGSKREGATRVSGDREVSKEREKPGGQRERTADDARVEAGLSWRHSVVARNRNHLPSGRDGGMTSVRSGPAGTCAAFATTATRSLLPR